MGKDAENVQEESRPIEPLLPGNRWELRFRCVVCGKLTGGRRPRGGDGTLYYPRRHKGEDGQRCEGIYEEAEWVNAQVPDK